MARKLGIFGIRPRIALEILDFEDDTPLLGSRLRCFIYLSPFIFRVVSLMWLCMSSSTNFSPFRGPLRSAYNFNGVCFSCKVPNFTMSLCLTVTTGFPGSLVVDVVELTLRIFKPGASTSYRPSIFFFERRLLCIFLATFNSSACCFRGRGRQAFVRRKRDSPSVPFRSLL